MLALHLHPALRLSALPRFEQTHLLNKHKLTATKTISKAQLSKTRSGWGFAAVSLLHARKGEKKGNAAGMCQQEIHPTPPGASARAGSSRQKVTVLLLCQPSPAVLYQARDPLAPSSSCWGAQCPATLFFPETTAGHRDGLHPWRKAAAFLCTTLTFSFSSFTADFSVTEHHNSYTGLQIQKTCSLPLI